MDSALEILDLDELIVLAKLDLEASNLSDALIKLKFAYSKDAKGEVLIMLARLYARLGLFAKATPLFSKFLDENPEALVERFQFGMTYFDSEKFEQAFEIFESIIEKEPNHPPAMFYSALILSKQNKVNDAVAQLENILTTVDKKNLFYTRAHEQLMQLDNERASRFSVLDSNSSISHENAVLN